MDFSNTTAYRAPVQLTITPLSASATTYYPNSSGQDRLGGVSLFGHINGYAFADVAGTLTLEECDTADGVWATVGTAATVSASTLATYGWTALTKKRWRWKYVNGGDAQTTFKLMEDKTPDAEGASDPTSVVVTGRSSLYAGTGTAALSGSNAAAITAQACNAVVVQNDPDSTVDLMVGNSITVVPLQLLPGQSVTIPVTNTNLVFLRSNHAATAATYNWLAV